MIGEKVRDACRAVRLTQVIVGSQVIQVSCCNRPIRIQIEQYIGTIKNESFGCARAGGTLNPASQAIVLVSDALAVRQADLSQSVFLIPSEARCSQTVGLR